KRKWTLTILVHGVMDQPPYRCHSLERALDTASGGGYEISEASFVASITAEYRFDLALKMDSCLRSLYRCFEGATSNRVDCRDVLCCVQLLRRCEKIRQNPRRLLEYFLGMYLLGGGWIRRRDALRVHRMASTTFEEIQSSSGRLDRYLTGIAAAKGLKPGFRQMPLSTLMEVVENHPVVLAVFQEQLWQRLPDKNRLALLDVAEGLRFMRTGYDAMSTKCRRAFQWHELNVYRRVLKGWTVYLVNQRLIKAQRKRVLNVARRATLHQWHTYAVHHAVYRNRVEEVHRLARRITLHRYFNRVVKMAKSAKRIRSLTWKTSKEGKLVIAGVGMIRAVLRRKSLRLAIRNWCEVASLINALEFAECLSKERHSRKVFGAWRDVVNASVAQTRLEEEAMRRALNLAEAMQEAEAEERKLREAALAKAERSKAAQKAALKVERALANKLEAEAKQAKATERERPILSRQREARRRRVYEEEVSMQQEFEEIWKKRMVERVSSEIKTAVDWIESNDPEVKFKLQKELQVVKRKFYAPPSPETADVERALRDPANAIFAHMAHRLYKKDMTLLEFFNQFDKEGDGYLAHDEFKVMVASLQIKLTGEQIRSVLRSIDLDGGGFIDFPEFEAAVKRHEEVCGTANSPWKMYVSIVHAVMIFHNVETNEEIWDYKAKDSDLMRVVRDNFVGVVGFKAKEEVTREKEKDWEDRHRGRAAAVIQRQFHARKARKKRALVSWKWDLERTRGKTETANRNATVIQCWWRVRRAKLLALALLDITVETLYDPELRARYYFNHCTKTSSWQPPFMLQRWRGPGAGMPPMREWVHISRLYGMSFFFNTRNGMRLDERPPGCMRCMACRFNLAVRRCDREGRDLCFSCYRSEHLEGRGCWHPWSQAEVHVCQVCGQRDTTLVCRDC
ncbi:unnamed protein product, partial [Discosporangium mesarthrocarpum]